MRGSFQAMVGVDNQTQSESVDDHRATQLRDVQGCHSAPCRQPALELHLADAVYFWGEHKVALISHDPKVEQPSGITVPGRSTTMRVRTTTHNHPGEPGVILIDQPLSNLIVGTNIRDGLTTLFGTVDLQVSYSGKYDIRVELSPDELSQIQNTLVKLLLEKIDQLSSPPDPDTPHAPPA